MAARNIFICYRRDDSAGDAGRLFDRLNERFPGRVFMDVAGISVATRWAEAIERSLRDCAVIVVIIGKRWLETGAVGTRRLDNPDDPIRKEILTALRLGIPVVPLAVAGAAIPDRKALPPELAPLVEWQAHRIDHEDFDHDSERLIRQLEQALGESAPVRRDASEARRDANLPPIVTGAGGAGAVAAKSLWFGLTLGSLKLWITVGMAAMAFVAVGVGGLLNSSSAPPSTQVGNPDTGSPVTTSPASPKPALPSADDTLGGQYLLASYAFQGVPVALKGTLTLTPAGGAAYTFTMQLVDGAGRGLFYNGQLQRQGPDWLATIASSNDPTAVYTPIPTRMAGTGAGLRVMNALGQDAVWQRQ